MMTGRGSALPRSIVVLFALLVALLAAVGEGAAGEGAAGELAAVEVTAAEVTASAAPPRPVAASCARTEHVTRTGAAEVSTIVEPAAEPPAVTAPVADRAPALTSQDTACAAVSRAPPHAA
ncbi:hypothetical protein Q0Z83_078060 [Actinoplanes sichuanensis]|uniref:Secreted protein n=1 Tax=Actinoplanes sichuanensis TaxID=512349 RepID=A0ABW4ADW5_9ACTN|nr:hypothetical protein [Actinoplanes sichuanensis]BEL09615.1 hypothetical protein Q0Z83_078060 [Actinoplanes sichuanensis]